MIQFWGEKAGNKRNRRREDRFAKLVSRFASLKTINIFDPVPNVLFPSQITDSVINRSTIIIPCKSDSFLLKNNQFHQY